MQSAFALPSFDFLDLLMKLLAGGLVLAFCLPIHECAHAWMAERLGDPTGRLQGRISLNPMNHLDLWGTIMLLVSSVMGFGFGWAKPVQVNARNFKNPKKGMALTALAGPMANLLLAFVTMIIYKVLAYLTNYGIMPELLGLFICTILQYIVIINVGLAAFNLLPAPPLDGSRIVGLFLSDKVYYKMMQYERYIALGVMLLVITGILNPVIGFLQNIALKGLGFLTGFVDIIMKAILN